MANGRCEVEASRDPSASSRGKRSGAASTGEGSCSTAMLRTASDSGSHPRITALSAVLGSVCWIAFSLTYIAPLYVTCKALNIISLSRKECEDKYY